MSRPIISRDELESKLKEIEGRFWKWDAAIVDLRSEMLDLMEEYVETTKPVILDYYRSENKKKSVDNQEVRK